MTAKRKTRQKHGQTNRHMKRLMASRQEKRDSRRHDAGCLAMHHQAGVDYDRDCPACMAELPKPVVVEPISE